MQFVEFTHPDDAEIDLHLFQQLIAGEIPEYTMEKRYIHRDGHVVWGDLAVTVIRHDDGSPRYILGMVIDISERKRAERERLVFQRLVEATGQGIGMACLDGTLHYLNPSLREMLGFGPDQQIPDVRIDTFYGNRWKPKVIEQVIPHVLENGRWRGDLEITRLDGTTFPSIESYFLIRDEAGEPLYIGDVITDISEERDVQAVLQAKSAELEQAVSDLERSNAELEQFAYVASHDLQEPLRMVASYLQLLERRYGDTLEGDAREFIDYAVDGATRMKVLINALLEFSRVGTRGQPFEPVDLSSATADVLRRLRPAIEEHGAHVTCETLPTLQADPVQIAQLLQNLVANAIKYRGEATPEIRISAEPYDATAWAISVSDNGIGIEPPYRDQVFEVFRRLHGRDEYPGTGIGLAICRKIVERHGGQIWIEGSPLGGSTFRFIIPSSEETGHDP
jgi:PAS domain S-box-containing protein